MSTARPAILFGEHSTQGPAIERDLDHGRFAASFGDLVTAEFTGFDLVVPLAVRQIDAARRANADGQRRVVLPAPELVALCDDKLALNRWWIDHGFGAHVPELLDEVPTRYPYIRKARTGNYGSGIAMVRDAEEGERLGPIDDRSFHQRAVPGEAEYVLHLLRIDGMIRFKVGYRYDMKTPLAVRGELERPRAIVPDEPEQALPLCTAILDALDFEGTCCFNYKLEHDVVLLLELNPRFGGSLVGEVTRYVAAHLEAIGKGA